MEVYISPPSPIFRSEAYVASPSGAIGRGELVVDPLKIALKYLSKGFWLDVLAALPLPQVIIWGIFLDPSGPSMSSAINALRFCIFIQYVPRLFIFFPLSSYIIKTSDLVTKKAWGGAAYNLMLYYMASNAIGACWYLLSVERQKQCWSDVCHLNSTSCTDDFFDCQKVNNHDRISWFRSTNITQICDTKNNFIQYGIYEPLLSRNLTSLSFQRKYFYCLWWGLKTLSCVGQNLQPSSYLDENCFAVAVMILGLVLFTMLIVNMKTYLDSTSVRQEDWRIKKTDTDQWVQYRQLPMELRNRIKKYDQFKWMTTRGADEEEFLKELPVDIRRDVKRHLCLDLVRQVPLFDQMDEMMLDAICERLKPALFTQGTYLVREDDPVDEMLFIISGYLDSFTTNGGRSDFFNSCRLGPGDFCGEELLTWALESCSSSTLPLSTRTIKSTSEVEAFTLPAEDLMFVARQFRGLDSKELRHKLRFSSPQWRTWAACYIQAAWRGFKKRKGCGVVGGKKSPMRSEEVPLPLVPRPSQIRLWQGKFS